MDLRRGELGAFLRARREALQPEDLGLPAGGRRRTPGLRREEVAQLCGIGSTWYTWLEQGRVDGVSIRVLEALAAALRMGPAQRQYLFELAGKAPPVGDVQREDLPAVLAAIVRELHHPAYVLDPYGNAARWNAPAAALFIGWLDEGAEERNLLRYMFLNPQARRLVPDWEGRARRLVAEFRAGSAHLGNDPFLARLLADLGERSEAFRRLWDLQDVSWREVGWRDFQHPSLGALRFEQISFRPAGAGEWRLTVLVPESETGSG